jgi:polysaccharide export outer membrane protein
VQAQVKDLPTVGLTAPEPGAAYRIGALDKLNITVFQVKDLTLEKVQVDASGQVLLPLVGAVTAAGKTTAELSADIATKLQKDFMQSPQVSVLVEESASQKVTVDGAVKKAGVFDMKGRTSLMQAVAMAEGADRDAKLKEVVVFRTVAGQRQAAKFDLTAIRKGTVADPELQGGDVVVIPGSSVARTVRDVLQAMPAFAIFRPY